MQTTQTASRPKRLSHDARRQQIIETTLSCLARTGADGTSLRSVCRELDVAPSLIKHFFEGWHDLLVAAYNRMAERFLATVTPVLEGTFPNARTRMDRLMEQYLSTSWVGENTIGAHIAIWHLSRTIPELRDAFTRFLEDRKSPLRHVLGQLAAERNVALDLEEATSCFILMMDGIWLEISLNPGTIDGARARQMCWFWIDALTGQPPRATPVRKQVKARLVSAA